MPGGSERQGAAGDDPAPDSARLHAGQPEGRWSGTRTGPPPWAWRSPGRRSSPADVQQVRGFLRARCATTIPRAASGQHVALPFACYSGISTVSMSSTVAFPVGMPPQTIFAESFTVKESPDPEVVRLLPSRVLKFPSASSFCVIVSPTTW